MRKLPSKWVLNVYDLWIFINQEAPAKPKHYSISLREWQKIKELDPTTMRYALELRRDIKDSEIE